MRSLLAAAAATAVPLLAAACTATPPGTPAPAAGTAAAGHSASPAAGHSASPAAAAPSPSPAASPLTGSQLKAALVPAAWFPAGFRPDHGGAVDTGDRYQPATAPGQLPCSRLDTTSWVQLGGVGAVSFAQNDYLGARRGEYAQEIDAFQALGAQRAMANLRRLPSRCPAFHDRQTHSTVAVHLRQGPSLGEDALTFRLTDPRWDGDVTLEAVRVRGSIVSVLFSAPGGTGQAQATRLATAITRDLRPQG